MNRSLLHRRSSFTHGFTLVEVMVASALLGASLIVMFGFHAQAVRSNMNARRLTDCTYLAQTQMERLQAADWTATSQPTSLQDAGMSDADYDMWSALEQGTGVEVNAANNDDESLGPVMYSISWDVTPMDADSTWLRLRVRCNYEDVATGFYHGTTVSSFRFRDS